MYLSEALCPTPPLLVGKRDQRAPSRCQVFPNFSRLWRSLSHQIVFLYELRFDNAVPILLPALTSPARPRPADVVRAKTGALPVFSFSGQPRTPIVPSVNRNLFGRQKTKPGLTKTHCPWNQLCCPFCSVFPTFLGLEAPAAACAAPLPPYTPQPLTPFPRPGVFLAITEFYDY